MRKATTLESLLARAKVSGPDDCWPWVGKSTRRRGYGVISHNNKTMTASRLSWIFHHGEIPSKKIFVCHKCDNPPCINPNHLFLGTNSDNVRDAIKKGRHKYNAQILAAGRLLGSRSLKSKRPAKSHCLAGHPFEGANIISRFRAKKGLIRECRACKNAYLVRYRLKKKAEKSLAASPSTT